MRRIAAVSVFALAVSGLAHAQAAPPSAVQIRGHYIGEPVTRFVKLEVDARDEVDVCRDHPDRVDCIHILNAVDGKGRAEISTIIPADLFHLTNSDARDSINFTLDGGQLVKLTMSVNDLPALMQSLGHASSESDAPAQGANGAKWTNHISVWDTPAAYISVYQDNNPVLTDHRPVLVIETPAEHARNSVADVAAKQSVSAQSQ